MLTAIIVKLHFFVDFFREIDYCITKSDLLYYLEI